MEEYDNHAEERLFRKLEASEKNDEFIAVQSKTFIQAATYRFCRNKRAVISLIILALIILFSIFGPMLCKYSYDQQNTVIANQGPSLDHFFGTDKFGRDLYVRILSGARISLLVGLVAAIGNLLMGTVYGGVSGYFGGKVDTVMMRIVDIIYSIPAMLYIVLIMLMFGASVVSIIIGISITSWIDMARIVRSEIKTLKEQEFTMAAFVLGANDRRILFKHLLINAVGSIIVTVTLMVPQAIFTEAWLSFLGVGISAPLASWGTLAQDARALLQVYPMQTVYPLVAICVTIFAFTFVGEGLGKALDPKTKR